MKKQLVVVEVCSIHAIRASTVEPRVVLDFMHSIAESERGWLLCLVCSRKIGPEYEMLEGIVRVTPTEATKADDGSPWLGEMCALCADCIVRPDLMGRVMRQMQERYRTSAAPVYVHPRVGRA